MNKRKLFANTIEYTNPPGKSENCLDKMVLFSKKRNFISHSQGGALGIQPILGYRVLKQTDSKQTCSLTYKPNFIYPNPLVEPLLAQGLVLVAISTMEGGYKA